MLGLDEGHDRVSVESRSSIEHVKLWRNDRVEPRNVVDTGCGEYCANGFNDLALIDRETLLVGSRSRRVCRED